MLNVNILTYHQFRYVCSRSSRLRRSARPLRIYHLLIIFYFIIFHHDLPKKDIYGEYKKDWKFLIVLSRRRAWLAAADWQYGGSKTKKRKTKRRKTKRRKN